MPITKKKKKKKEKTLGSLQLYYHKSVQRLVKQATYVITIKTCLKCPASCKAQ